MKFKDKIHGDVGVITLKGKLMGMPDTETLHDEVRAMLGQKVKKIVLDMEGVDWVNSVGVGAIMRSYATVKNQEGQFVLSSITGKVSSVLVLMQLNKVFKTYSSAKEALEALQS